MAIGDDAQSEGYPIVPSTGAGGEVYRGGDEITKTRDFVAQLKKMIKTKPLARQTSGLSSGTAAPNNANGDNGDWYMKTL